MCLIILLLLRVGTSKSMIPRPCFLPLLYYFHMLLLLFTLMPLLFQITQITSHTPYYTVSSVSSVNQCIYTITIVLGVLRTQENHPVNCTTVFFHLLLLIYFIKCFSGLAELTTRLLRLICILWLPLCRISKLGYTYPRRLSRSPTVAGYHSLSWSLPVYC